MHNISLPNYALVIHSLWQTVPRGTTTAATCPNGKKWKPTNGNNLLVPLSHLQNFIGRRGLPCSDSFTVIQSPASDSDGQLLFFQDGLSCQFLSYGQPCAPSLSATRAVSSSSTVSKSNRQRLECARHRLLRPPPPFHPELSVPSVIHLQPYHCNLVISLPSPPPPAVVTATASFPPFPFLFIHFHLLPFASPSCPTISSSLPLAPSPRRALHPKLPALAIPLPSPSVPPSPRSPSARSRAFSPPLSRTIISKTASPFRNISSSSC